jgi:hypothetical protein
MASFIVLRKRIPREHRAHRATDVPVADVPIEDPGPGEVKVRIEADRNVWFAIRETGSASSLSAVAKSWPHSKSGLGRRPVKPSRINDRISPIRPFLKVQGFERRIIAESPSN